MRDLTDIDDIFYNGGYDVDIYFTKSRGDATDKVVRAAMNYDIVVCAGGDGTYNEVISGVLKANLNIPVGYIPAGTTNDFASTLGISPILKNSAQKVVLGEPVKLDVGRFGEKYFSYIASFGAFTGSSYKTNQKVKNILGHLAYVLEGIKDLSALKSYKIRIETQAGVIEDDFIFGAVCNSRSIAGIIKLEEDIVNLSDGQFEVILVRMPAQIIELPKMLTALQNGSNENDNVVFIHADKIKIKTPGRLDWSLDGEHAVTTGAVVIENLNHAVSLVL